MVWFDKIWEAGTRDLLTSLWGSAGFDLIIKRHELVLQPPWLTPPWQSCRKPRRRRRSWSWAAGSPGPPCLERCRDAAAPPYTAARWHRPPPPAHRERHRRHDRRLRCVQQPPWCHMWRSIRRDEQSDHSTAFPSNTASVQLLHQILWPESSDLSSALVSLHHLIKSIPWLLHTLTTHCWCIYLTNLSLSFTLSED